MSAGLASRLNSRIDVYSKSEDENKLGEKIYKYAKLKSVWAEITPGTGTTKEGEGNTVSADISHKFVIRSGVIPNLANDMYFMFKGQRYDIKYFNPNYKYRDIIEIMCSLVVE